MTDERKGRLGLGTGCPQDVWQKGSCFSYILRVHQETFWININWRLLLTFTLDRRRFFFLRNPHEHCDQLGLRHGYQADQPRGKKKKSLKDGFREDEAYFGSEWKESGERKNATKCSLGDWDQTWGKRNVILMCCGATGHPEGVWVTPGLHVSRNSQGGRREISKDSDLLG